MFRLTPRTKPSALLLKYKLPPPIRHPQQFLILSRDLHSVVPFQQIIAATLWQSVLANRGVASDSNFLFVGCLKKKIRTDKLFSLHSFITVTEFSLFPFIPSLHSAKYYYSLLLFCGLPHNRNRQQGVLGRFAGSKTTVSAKALNRTLIILCSLTLLSLPDNFQYSRCGYLPPPIHP